MATLFIYGTLQHRPVIEALLGRVPEMQQATVAGYRAAPLSGRVYPGLVEDRHAVVDGHVFEADASEVVLLDRFEGPEYERRPVEAQTSAGSIRCEAWTLIGSARDLVKSGAWSLDRFVAEHAADFLGGP